MHILVVAYRVLLLLYDLVNLVQRHLEVEVLHAFAHLLGMTGSLLECRVVLLSLSNGPLV